MVLQGILIVICLVLLVYLSMQLYTLNLRLREDARTERMRNAVDWTKPPSRRKQKSRISDFLKI